MLTRTNNVNQPKFIETLKEGKKRKKALKGKEKERLERINLINFWVGTKNSLGKEEV